MTGHPSVVRVSELSRFGAPPALVEVWAAQVEELTEVQTKAVTAGAISGNSNLLVVAPTSSGKTFVAEMAAVSAAYRTRKHALFLVPFRALADEHYANLRARYGNLLSVVISTGDWTEFDDDIRAGNFGLAVLTYEKLVGLLVEHPQILDRCSTVVVDEVQMLGDRGRGADLEMLLTQVLRHGSTPRIVALSASLDQLNLLDRWLQATLVIANERPVPLEEGVLAPSTGCLLRRDGTSTQVGPGDADPERALMAAIANVVQADKQALVFRSSIGKTLATAEQLKYYLAAPGLPSETGRLLDELEPSDTVEILRRLLASRIAFHNADLTAAERRAVETSFRLGECRVLVSTTTLAMGVNLPTDVVFVGDSIRWLPDRGDWRSEDLTVAEYKNAAGRAGRLGLKSAGQAILVAQTDTAQRQLLDYYCNGEVEPVKSRLAGNVFDDVVFGVLCAGLAENEEGLVDFIASTFAYATFYETSGGIPAVRDGVARAAATCQDSGLIEREGDRLVPTPPAYVFARRHIPLKVAARLSVAAGRLALATTSREEILFAVASCDELFDARPYVRWDKVRHQPVDPRPGLAIASAGVDADSLLDQALRKATLSEADARILSRTDCLVRWTTGGDAAVISKLHRGCPPPRVAGMGKTASWLLEALGQIAALRGADSDRLAVVALEARYGVPRDLVAIARLNAPGIGRGSLLRLYAGDSGRRLFDPDVILDADDGEFAGLLRPVELARLRAAIIQDRGETLRRRRDAQLERAQSASLDARLVSDLYDASGLDLEQAVADALTSTGLSVTRLTRQTKGEEDLQVTHPEGTIVVSVTASMHASKHISWNKAKEVLGAGVGINPINYVCVGRPGFHSLAEEAVRKIAHEEGHRRLLLVPMDVIAEAVVRCREGAFDGASLLDLLARARGLLTLRDLPYVHGTPAVGSDAIAG